MSWLSLCSMVLAVGCRSDRSIVIECRRRLISSIAPVVMYCWRGLKSPVGSIQRLRCVVPEWSVGDGRRWGCPM
eukprot:2396922-Pyramimonas_sp.AAC.2